MWRLRRLWWIKFLNNNEHEKANHSFYTDCDKFCMAYCGMSDIEPNIIERAGLFKILSDPGSWILPLYFYFKIIRRNHFKYHFLYFNAYWSLGNFQTHPGNYAGKTYWILNYNLNLRVDCNTLANNI